MSTETVRARKVNQFYSLAIGLQGADMPFDGNAGIIANTLPETRQSIEQSAFARIWTADDRNAGIGLPAYGNIG